MIAAGGRIGGAPLYFPTTGSHLVRVFFTAALAYKTDALSIDRSVRNGRGAVSTSGDLEQQIGTFLQLTNVRIRTIRLQ